MITTLGELFSIAITAVAVSYIFTAFVPKRTEIHQIEEYSRSFQSLFNWEDFKIAAMVGVPAILLHELFHKFASIAFGIPAVYNVSLFGLGLGILLKAIGSGFIILLPGYVSILGSATPLQMTLIAFSGPLANLLLWIASSIAVKYSANLNVKYQILIHLSKRVNMWLFIFNMLPIPPLDGSKVIIGLYHLIGGLV